MNITIPDLMSDAVTFEAKATKIADMLKAMAHPRRLMVLCKLTMFGSATVNELAAAVGLSQSALSQHLALMREEGLVAFDRKAQTLHYRIAEPRVARHLAALYDLYCAPPDLLAKDQIHEAVDLTASAGTGCKRGVSD